MLPRLSHGGSVVDGVDPDEDQIVDASGANLVRQSTQVIDVCRSLAVGHLCVAQRLASSSERNVECVDQSMNRSRLSISRHQQARSSMRQQVCSHLLDPVVGGCRRCLHHRSHIGGQGQSQLPGKLGGDLGNIRGASNDPLVGGSPGD